MAQKDAGDLNNRSSHAHVFGNLAVEEFSLDLNGIDIAEVGRLFIIPRGATLYDSKLYMPGGGTATATLDLGIIARDTGALGDAGFFNLAVLLSAAAVVRADEVNAPLYLSDDDYYLAATIAVANSAAAVVVKGWVAYKFSGNL